MKFTRRVFFNDNIATIALVKDVSATEFTSIQYTTRDVKLFILYTLRASTNKMENFLFFFSLLNMSEYNCNYE